MRRRPTLALCLLAAGACLAAEPEATPRTRPDVAERLARHRPRLRSTDRATRQAAYDAFLREGDAGRMLLRDALLALRKQVLVACRSVYLAEPTQQRMLRAHAKMAAARQEALRVIFDKRVYPDANHGRSGQPVVDKAVAVVKAMHPSYERLFASPAKRFARVLRAYDRLLELDEQLAQCSVADLELKPPLADVAGGIPPELVEILKAEVDFRSTCARCLRYNRKVRTSLTANERKVVDLTNEYRMQLGIRPLAINERLVQAARKHSAEMAALGYFAHSSPKPERRTPSQRCRLEGYNHFRGENCAYGTGASGSFHGWYNSSGHHRNMIHPKANEIGVGHAGPWTEDFGANPALDLDQPPRRRDDGHKPPHKPPARPKRKRSNPWEKLLPP